MRKKASVERWLEVRAGGRIGFGKTFGKTDCVYIHGGRRTGGWREEVHRLNTADLTPRQTAIVEKRKAYPSERVRAETAAEERGRPIAAFGRSASPRGGGRPAA